jgi:hypothetical protein
MSSLLGPVQDIENTLSDMNDFRYLPDAYGQQLDNIGKIVGLERVPGMSDATYIQELYGQIKINSSDGEPEQAIQVFLLFTQTMFCILYEGHLASILLEGTWNPPSQAEVDQLLSVIQATIPAGVRCDGIVYFDPSNAFAYDGPLSGAGYDDGSQTVGGQYAQLWELLGPGFAYDGDDTLGLGYGTEFDPLSGGSYLT